MPTTFGCSCITLALVSLMQGCMLIALGLEVLFTEPRSVVAPVDQCVEFSCVVGGGQAGWMVSTGYDEHQFTKSDEKEGVYINSSADHSILTYCETGNITMTVKLQVRCFAYNVGDKCTQYGEYCYTTLYGIPWAPTSSQPSTPGLFAWKRSRNMPDAVNLTYILTIVFQNGTQKKYMTPEESIQLDHNVICEPITIFLRARNDLGTSQDATILNSDPSPHCQPSAVASVTYAHGSAVARLQCANCSMNCLMIVNGRDTYIVQCNEAMCVLPKPRANVSVTAYTISEDGAIGSALTPRRIPMNSSDLSSLCPSSSSHSTIPMTGPSLVVVAVVVTKALNPT